MKLTVKHIDVLLTDSTDLIYLETELPLAVWPFRGNAYLKIEAAHGAGIEYVKKHFGIDPHVRDIRYIKKGGR